MLPKRLTLLAEICAAVAGVLIFGLRASLASSSTIIISAVYYDTYLPNEPDEAIQLMNVSTGTISLSNWTLSDGEGIITLTDSLSPGASVWIAKSAISFTIEFGFPPAYEYGGDSDPSVPDRLKPV